MANGGEGLEDPQLPQGHEPSVAPARAVERTTSQAPTVPHLASPARMAANGGRATGSTPGYTGKVMVARKSAWPPWATAALARWHSFTRAVWRLVPPQAHAGVRRFGPWVAFWTLGLLCGFWWSPAPRPATSPVAPPVAAAPPVVAVPIVTPAPSRPLYNHCSVTFSTEPPGALVHWGDLRLGETPLGGVTVPCGRSLVVFRLAGFEPLVATMTATLDGPVVFSQTLKRTEATLDLSSTPSGAEAFVNGKPAGTTPVSFAVPAGQPFDLKLQKTGYVPLKRTMRIAGQKSLQRSRAQVPKAKRKHRSTGP